MTSRRRLLDQTWGAVSSSEQALLGALGVLVLLGIWQGLAILGVAGSLTFPSPAQTASALGELVITGEILPDLAASAVLFFASLAAGVALGIPLGFLAGWFPTLRSFVAPHIALLYSVPAIGLLPLFLVWLGFGFPSQFATVLLFTVFPPYYAAFQSVTTADPNLVRVARSYGASDTHVFSAIILPGSIPVLLYGVRVAVVMAIRGVVLAELIASTAGVGYLLRAYGDHFRTANIFALIIVLSIVGLVADLILRRVQGQFDVWRPENGREAVVGERGDGSVPRRPLVTP